MPYAPEELEIAKQAAEIAKKFLPTLRAEMEELRRRIDWHAGNVERYEQMVGKPAEQTAQERAANPASPQYTVVVRPLDSEFQLRAKRGEVRPYIEQVLQTHPGLSGRQIRDMIEKTSGKVFGYSTVYRELEKMKETRDRDKEQTPV